jgi:hypothetical protein
MHGVTRKLSATFLLLKIIKQDMVKIVYGTSCKVPVLTWNVIWLAVILSRSLRSGGVTRGRDWRHRHKPRDHEHTTHATINTHSAQHRYINASLASCTSMLYSSCVPHVHTATKNHNTTTINVCNLQSATISNTHNPSPNTKADTRKAQKAEWNRQNRLR